ncbi:MAG: hydrolase [Syntrophaceae bacterium]|nr:hydrolase [Syntrophaceae bacterium]
MLKIDRAVLVAIDIQGNLYRAMDDREFLLQNCRKLLLGARALGIPVILTEQVKIGETVPEIRELLPDLDPIVKETFSCWHHEPFAAALMATGRKQVILLGIEAHVCVYQTCMDLLEAGFEVYLASDAVSSRTTANREIGIGRMTAEGAILASTEMMLFELLGTAAHPKAKELFKLIK